MGSDYWTELREWLEQVAVGAGTLSLEDLVALEITDDPDEVVSRVQTCHETLCRKLGIHG